MFSSLLVSLLNGFLIGIRSVKVYLTRGVLNVWTKMRQVTQVASGTTRVVDKATKNISELGQKPAKRSDFIETGRMFISKTFLFRVLLWTIVGIAIIYFLIYPLAMRYFFTARMTLHTNGLMNYTGKVIVYSDKKKSIPSYEGYLKEGLLQGNGKQYDTDGVLTYEGGFLDGKRSGAGEEYESGSLIYRGEFASDRYEGVGEQYADGLLICSGTYVNGRLDGNDCYVYYPNGRTAYRGAFTVGNQTGEGISYGENGIQTYAGTFRNGAWHGEGTAYDESGEPCYTGGFSNNQYEGAGILYLDNDFRLEGEFLRGKQSGDAVITRNGITYYEGCAANTVPNGQGTLYNNLGNVLFSGTMRAGTISGKNLLNKPYDAVVEMLGDVYLTTEETENGKILSSGELGLDIYFSRNSDLNDELIALDVFLHRVPDGDDTVQQLLWSFADDIDAWRDELWPHADSVVAGYAVPRLAARAFADKSYPCVIYPDDYASCTIWSDGSKPFGLQWTVAYGQAIALQSESVTPEA